MRQLLLRAVTRNGGTDAGSREWAANVVTVVRSILVSTLLMTFTLLSSGATAATPFPRFVTGKAHIVQEERTIRLSLDATDGGADDEGDATLRFGRGRAIPLDLTCTNVLSATTALIAGVTSDGLTSYLMSVEDHGVGKDSLGVAETPAAEPICQAGLDSPIAAPERISRGDLLIRTT